MQQVLFFHLVYDRYKYLLANYGYKFMIQVYNGSILTQFWMFQTVIEQYHQPKGCYSSQVRVVEYELLNSGSIW